MHRKTVIGFVSLSLLCAAFLYSGTSAGRSSGKDKKAGGRKIAVALHPSPSDFRRGEKSDKLPEARHGNFDLRGFDLRALDLSGKDGELLKNSGVDFDDVTKWPGTLPAGFDPKVIMEHNKVPEFDLRDLHKKGITGKGVGIAIIDYALLVDHIEFGKRVKMYEHLHYDDNHAQMHGPAVASIAVGKTVGVAPEATLYFVACQNSDTIDGKMVVNAGWTAKAVERIIEVNRMLPKNKKIRVLSISEVWCPTSKGYAEMTAAVKKAEAEGIWVVTCSLFETSGYRYFVYGLSSGRDADRSTAASFRVIPWPDYFRLIGHISGAADFLSAQLLAQPPAEQLLVPIDCKTVASPTGTKDYVYYQRGGWSWWVPYVAGLYTLACQVKPDVTPELFWETALSTGQERPIVRDDRTFVGKIIDPVRLIESLNRK